MQTSTDTAPGKSPANLRVLGKELRRNEEEEEQTCARRELSR